MRRIFGEKYKKKELKFSILPYKIQVVVEDTLEKKSPDKDISHPLQIKSHVEAVSLLVLVENAIHVFLFFLGS